MEPVASGSANSEGYFDIALADGGLSEGDLVSLTATDPDGNTSEPSQIRRPVIVVPGIGGSWLEALDGGDNLWVPLALTDAATDDRLVRMGMTVTGTSLEPIIADGVLEEVGFPYRPIVIWLQDAGYPGSSTKWKASTGEPDPGPSMELDLWRFSNDWRLNQFQLARNLRDRVEWLTTQRDEVTRSCEIDLVAHSNGGVVSAAFIRGFPETARDRVVRYVSMAAPYMGAAQATAAHTKGYAFEIENQLPGYDPEWGKLLKMARNLIGAYGLIPSKNYWTASAQFSDGRRAMMEDLRGRGLSSYDAVRKFLVTPKSKSGLERNAALLDKMSSEVQSLIDDWRDWEGPPHIFRIVAAKAHQEGFRSSSTAVGWYNDANAFPQGRISGWRAEEGDEPDHELYRSAQMPILGQGDGTVPISSATLGRDNGRTDLSGVRLSGGSRNRWIEEFEDFPCDHVGLIGPDCKNAFGVGSLERMTQIVKSSYEVLPFGGGKLEASPKSGIEGEENLLYVSGTNAIGVHVYDETGNHTGPATPADFRRIRTDVPALGYWHSERTVAIALPSGQSYRIEVYAPVEESRIRISRVIADASGTNRHILFDDQVLAQGGSLSIVVENSVTSEGQPIQVDADGNGSFEGILSPAPAFSAMSTRPAVPFPDPLAIQATGYKSEGGDVEIDVRFADFGASGWTWNAGETPDWIEVSRTEGPVPDSIVATLRGSSLAAGSFEASFPVTLSRDGFETVHAVRV
ncbi:MAG TPA: hypothetical protein VJB15_05275, partial [Rhodothermia bacterium]|nr:hypothetical protein [Rhodothermia bacterium]